MTASIPHTGSRAGAIFRVTSGNFLEQFDFFLFGFYATYIAAAFFPAANEFASLMMTFAVFGAGFLMRPLGAIILGAYIDDVGRRKGLIITLALAFPIGVAGAIYLEEFAPKNWFTDLIEVNIANLAAVPSIVFGILGLAVLINFVGTMYGTVWALFGVSNQLMASVGLIIGATIILRLASKRRYMLTCLIPLAYLLGDFVIESGAPPVWPYRAIYLLFWTLTLFDVLPFGVRTTEEDGSEPVPGQASSAPSNPMIGKKLLWTTLISGVLFGLFMANYEFGWIVVDDVPFWRTRGPYAPVKAG